MQEVSEGKDTITGHWEIAGLLLRPGFHVFPPGPPSFPPDLLDALERKFGRPVLGNRAASGTGMVEELGGESIRRGAWICYTSADSVFQVAAHAETIPLEELYAACEFVRARVDALRVGRVIARPFTGTPGAFTRTLDRKDFAYHTEEPTLLERLHQAGHPVVAVGKIQDIFDGRGITESLHTGDNLGSQAAVDEVLTRVDRGLVFANFIDFDMMYGHRRDPEGYARCLEQTDRWLAGLLPRLGPEDCLILTADHGNDPTFRGTDHTREFVPLLVYQPGRSGRPLGIRDGFFDIAQSLSTAFGLRPHPRGKAFLPRP